MNKPMCLFPECATVYPTLLAVYGQRATIGSMDDQKGLLDEAMQSFGGTDDAVNHLREMFQSYLHLTIQRDRLRLVTADHATCAYPEEPRTALDLYVIAKREREVLDAILAIQREIAGIGKQADGTHRRTCDICNKSHKNL
jgi:hypothetical protein